MDRTMLQQWHIQKIAFTEWLQYRVYQNFKYLPFKTDVKLKMDFNIKAQVKTKSLRNKLEVIFFFIETKKLN